MKGATITFRIDEVEKERLEKISAEKDIPISQIIREIIRKYLFSQN